MLKVLAAKDSCLRIHPISRSSAGSTLCRTETNKHGHTDAVGLFYGQKWMPISCCSSAWNKDRHHHSRIYIYTKLGDLMPQLALPWRKNHGCRRACLGIWVTLVSNMSRSSISRACVCYKRRPIFAIPAQGHPNTSISPPQQI